MGGISKWTEQQTRQEDKGMWVLPFDFRGLGHLADQGISGAPNQLLTVPGISGARTKCESGNGDCYLRFPWFFPIADVIDGDVWFPFNPKPLVDPMEALMHETQKDTMQT